MTAEINGSNTALPVNEKGIAWGSDVKHKFGSILAAYFNVDAATRGGSTITGASICVVRVC